MNKKHILTLALGLLMLSCGTQNQKADDRNKIVDEVVADNDSVVVSDFQSRQNEIQEAIDSNVEDFPHFLVHFVSQFRDIGNCNQFIHDKMGIHTGYNPGAFCMATHSFEPEVSINANIPLNRIVNRMPVGDFCEGYPDEEDGFYFIEISIQEMPKFVYFSEEGEICTLELSPPDGIKYEAIVKVVGILSIAQQHEFYFALVGKKWYLVCQNLCDCSA